MSSATSKCSSGHLKGLYWLGLHRNRVLTGCVYEPSLFIVSKVVSLGSLFIAFEQYLLLLHQLLLTQVWDHSIRREC